MQRWILEKDILKQLLRHDRTNEHSRLGVIKQLRILRQHDQGTRFSLGKIVTSPHYRVCHLILDRRFREESLQVKQILQIILTTK